LAYKKKFVLFPFMRNWSVANRIAFIGILVTIVGLIISNTPSWYKTFFTETSDKGNSKIYRLRVTVIGSEGTPLEDAKVWSSIGGEPKQVAGGWQFDIPVASRPKDGKLTVFASQKSAFLTGKKDLQLEKDYNPAITIHLMQDTSATVRGIVVDAASEEAILGALVNVIGYGDEAVRTGEYGSFELPAHAAEGQQVHLRVEKNGYNPVTQWHPAGKVAVEIYLERR